MCMTLDRSERTLGDMLREGRGSAAECPRCGRTDGVLRLVESDQVYDCPGPRCGVFTHLDRAGTQIDTASETGEVVEVQPLSDDQQVTRDVAACLREDKQQGVKGGGSSSGPSRKKPVKRLRQRVEQDAPIGRPERDKQRTVRLNKTRRIELTISWEALGLLKQRQSEMGLSHGKRVPIIAVIRSFLTAKNLSEELPFIDQLDHDQPKHCLQVRLTSLEISLLDERVRWAKKTQPHGLDIVSRGEVVETAVRKFLGDAT